MKKIKFPSQRELKKIRKQLNRGVASETLSPQASPVERMKYKLCEKFIIYKRENELSQVDLAQILEIDEALVSKLLHYHIKEFTTDRLIKYLAKIYPKIEVDVAV